MAPRMARSRRRSWLRVTAGPTARLMANATCGGETLGSSMNEHHIASLRTRTPSRRRRLNESRSQTRRIKSGGEACPALVTAGLQHSATGASAHAGAESMLTVPATVVWLKCALHDVLFRTYRVNVPGESRALMGTSCGLTKQGYGARGASPNHPHQPPDSRTVLRSDSIARSTVVKAHFGPTVVSVWFSVVRSRAATNNTHVSCSHGKRLHICPAYGMFLRVFPFRFQPAMFMRSPQARHISTSCGQLCGQGRSPTIPPRVEPRRSKEIETW